MADPGNFISQGSALTAVSSGAGLAIPTRSRRDGGFSGLTSIARVLDASTGAPGASGGRLSEILSSGAARNLSQAIDQLNPSERNALHARWGRSLDELVSLSHERDARVFHHGLLQVGRRLEDNDQVDLAGVVYSGLVAERSNSPHPPLNLRGGEEVVPPLRLRGGQEGLLPSDVAIQAQRRLNAINGVGDWRERFAFSLQRIPNQATRWDVLLAMTGAGFTFRGFRLLTTASWAGSFESALALNAASASTAFLAETIAFTSLGKVAGALAGHPQDTSANGIFNEWAGGAAMLLGLKGMGALTGAGVRSIYGEGVAATASGRLTQILAPQAGMFMGILVGNRLAEAGGFHPERHGDNWLVDGVTTLIEFNVAGRIQRAAGGPALTSLEGRMEAYTRELARAESGRRGPPLQGWADLFRPEFVTPEGVRLPLPSPSEDFARPEPLQMSSTDRKIPRSVGRISSLPAIRTNLRARALENPAAAVEYLRDATPVQSQRLIGELQRNNRILPLILEMEKHGYAVSIQDMLLEIQPLDYSRAVPKLQRIESDFADFYERRRATVRPEQHWKSFEEWQKVMYPADTSAMGNLIRVAKRMGVPDLFMSAFDLRRASIDLKARVKASPELSAYYYDLFLVREFLIEQGYNRVGKETNGRRLAELLLNKEGNCVTLSLLFTHLAGTLGREVSFGLHPDHLFLLTKSGGAIESTMDFGMTHSMAYQRRTRPVEKGPQDSRHMLGFHLLNLGKLFQQEQSIESAGESFELSQRLLPDNPRPPLELGRLALGNQNYAKAAEYFARVHELYPGEPNGYGRLRHIAWKALVEKDFEGAEDAFRRMNSVNSGDIDVYRGLQIIYEKQRRRSEAEWVQSMIELLVP